MLAHYGVVAGRQHPNTEGPRNGGNRAGFSRRSQKIAVMTQLIDSVLCSDNAR